MAKERTNLPNIFRSDRTNQSHNQERKQTATHTALPPVVVTVYHSIHLFAQTGKNCGGIETPRRPPVINFAIPGTHQPSPTNVLDDSLVHHRIIIIRGVLVPVQVHGISGSVSILNTVPFHGEGHAFCVPEKKNKTSETETGKNTETNSNTHGTSPGGPPWYRAIRLRTVRSTNPRPNR